MDLLNYIPEKEFTQNHLLALSDYSTDDILQVLKKALEIKNDIKNGIQTDVLKNKVLGMIFAKSSTRTRVSFEVGMMQLGGSAIFLSKNDIQLGRGESIYDTAKVLSRYLDGIMIRTFDHSDVEELAEYGSIPIINGLTDYLHPCQALADLMTVYEYKKTFKGKMAYIGDGNNVANSLIMICAKVGMDISVACPAGNEPDQEIIKTAEFAAKANGSKVIITDDPVLAIKDADAVYADVWTSMGQEAETEKRLELFKEYQINSKLFANAKPDAIFLHCLPAHRGEEVTAEVIDGSNSAVFDQAENRLHAQKAVMAMLIK